MVGGLLLAAAFPKPSVAGLAWVAPGLILFAALGQSGGAAFRIGYVAGMMHFLGSLHWLLWIPVNKIAPLSGWLALSAYLAVYPAVWVWLCWKLYPVDLSGGEFGLVPRLDRFISVPWLRRFWWTGVCAALWVALDMAQARLLTGFPWNFLGASQYRMLPLIQIASITGVYGITFCVVWFSVSLVCAFIALLRRPAPRWQWHRELAMPALLVIGIVTIGWRQVMRPDPVRPTLKIALVQPSIPQTWIWDPKESSNRFQQLIHLSEQALQQKPDLLVWPEAAVPYMVRFDDETHDAVTNLVRTHQTWLVLGSDDAEISPRSGSAVETNFYNSSFLISPKGELVATYRKQRLVIFGEYTPLSRWFPLIERLTGLGSFASGKRPVTFSLPDLKVKTSVLICYEDAFPHLTRAYVADDIDFLLNLTNNGWFGESAAQWQHAANAVLRAVENGLPLVRCANNGLTCWVDARGRMHEVYFPNSSDVYQAGFKIAQVPLLAGQKRPPTFYTRYGDLFGWGCAGLALTGVGLNYPRRKRY
jgi:apolipoprotein N-acyltransferase